ncbi:MAG: response regulator [Bdellovibrionales bacterium]|nr:response regulator [Bdellovibrionales bacterium]
MEEINILLVEDDPGDVKLTKRILEKSKLHLTLHVVDDGEKAIDYLKKQGEHSEASTPDLVLLDINLPKKDGMEVLKEIREDSRLTHMPVVILTTSKDQEDIAKSYKLHANCFVTKPVDLSQFTKVVQSIENFWLTVVKLPN